MAAPKRQPDDVRRDRELIAKLYVQGKTQGAIAEIISQQYDFTITQQTIALDLKEIRKKWLESSVRDFDTLKSEQLAKLDLMEFELWESWIRSKEPAKSISSKKGGKYSGEVTTKVEYQSGNPAYMAGIDRCIERRCRLLGLDAELRYADVNLAIAAVIRAGFIVQNPTLDVAAVEVEERKEMGGANATRHEVLDGIT